MNIKKLSLYMPLVLSVLIFSCSENPNVQSIQEQGGISLKLNKSAIPSNIVTVTVNLTREGYDPVTAEMNVLTDSTAEIAVNDLAVGYWHLLIEAKDSNSVVKYRGETDFEIVANYLSYVSLRLEEVNGTEVGSVFIEVTWGTKAEVKFTDYYGNPIFADDSNGLGISVVNLVKMDSQYNIYYCESYGNGFGDTRIAYTSDGMTWDADYNSNVVMPHGSEGNWDECVAAPGSVLYNNGSFKYFYQGRNINEIYNGGIAISQNGVEWERVNGPLFDLQSAGTYSGIGVNSVVLVNGTYYMFYSYKISEMEARIGLATSQDGENFTLYSRNPILTQTQSWESWEGVFSASVYYENGWFYMIYQGRGLGKFGLAKSADGKNWTKYDKNPVFSTENTTWSYKINYPTLIKINSEYKLYYCGYQDGKLRVGVATSSNIKF